MDYISDISSFFIYLQLTLPNYIKHVKTSSVYFSMLINGIIQQALVSRVARQSTLSLLDPQSTSILNKEPKYKN